MTEHLLHFIWQYRLYPLHALVTTTGAEIEVIDPGRHNTDAGPDFFNAKIKIGNMQWVGNVEIHVRASDWFSHHHDTDPAYNSIILHVVHFSDTQIARANGEPIAQTILPCPPDMEQRYDTLRQKFATPPCLRILATMPPFHLHSWLQNLQVERMQKKTRELDERLDRCGGDWEQAFFITLARNFGFGVNSEAFEYWAQHIPLPAVAKHRDDLFQVEAIFFGQAGLLEEAGSGDAYYLQLQKEYRYLAQKFDLMPIDPSLWRFLRLRPYNFPHIRIARLACLYHHAFGLFSKLLEPLSLTELRALFEGGTSSYWNNHFHFRAASEQQHKGLTQTTIDLILINTVAPTIYCYGTHCGDARQCRRAWDLWRMLRPEQNYITNQWRMCGLIAANAGESQALIQLRKEYCDVKRCLHCQIGYQYLKQPSPADPAPA